MKNEIKVTWFLEDISPLRSNLKGEVVKDIDRDKKPQGTKKLSKQVVQGQIFIDII